MSDLYEEDLHFERDLRYIPNLNEILSFSSSTQNELEISEQAIIDEFFSNNNSEEEKVTIPYSLNIREEESNINISPLNDKSCSTEKIIKILKENNIPKYIIDKIELSEITYKDIEIILNPKKTFITTKKRREKTKDNIEKAKDNIEKEKLKMGRNTKDDKTIRKHNKDSSDNIARKIKVYIFKALIKYFKINVSKDLKALDYEYISNLKKDINVKMLDSSLKEILSLDTSSKNGKDNIDHNKKIISDILEKESNNEKVKALLDM